WSRIKTLAALGVGSLVRVGVYRFGLRSGLHPVQRIAAEPAKGPFFAAALPHGDLPAPNKRCAEKLWWFDWYSKDRLSGAPDWFKSPFADEAAEAQSNWWEIPDFGGADIKGVWELSRFG